MRGRRLKDFSFFRARRVGNINLEFPGASSASWAPRVCVWGGGGEWESPRWGLKAFNALDNSATKSSLHVERCGLATRRVYPVPSRLAVARNLQKFLSLRRSVGKVNIVGRKLATWHTVLFLGTGTYPLEGIGDTSALWNCTGKNLDDRGVKRWWEFSALARAHERCLECRL